MKSSIWEQNPALCADLRVLWDEGLSVNEIARRLSARHGVPISRNAVIGRSHRQGFPPRRSPIRLGQAAPQQPRKAAPPLPRPAAFAPRAAAGQASPAPPRTAVAPAEPLPGAHLLQRRGKETCRWPISNGPPWCFCSQPQAEGARLPYCAHHLSIAIKPKDAA